MRVKPGDNATIYCDCTYQSKFTLIWFIKPAKEHQPPLINLTEDTTPPQYSRVWNYTKGTYDLLVKNITESDLGLYYCALHEIKFTRGRNGERVREDVYHEGNRTTFLSFLADGAAERGGNMEMRNHNEVGGGGGGGGGDVSYASLNIPSSGQRRLKKRTVESSDLCTYSESKVVWLVCFRCLVLQGLWRRSGGEGTPHMSTWLSIMRLILSESDLGLYYWPLHKTQPTRDKALACSGEDVCLYGNRTTRLSFHSKVSLVLVNTNVFIA
ncbi:hypothetical protein NFI96_030950, partial [Prochilodus magdalenae]